MSVLAVYGRFCAAVEQGQYIPQRNWLRDMMFGILSSRSLMLTEIARSLGERSAIGDPRRLIHTVKRLSRHLNTDHFDDEVLIDVLNARAAALCKNGLGVVVAMDYGDIAKPYARPHRERGQQHAVMCFDGSTRRKGIGYPMVLVEAILPNGNHFPVSMLPYSTTAPGYRSQSDEFRKVMNRLVVVVGELATWVLDRGFDGLPYIKALDEAGIRWVIRANTHEKKARIVFADGVESRIHELVEAAVPVVYIRHPKQEGARIGLSAVTIRFHNGRNPPNRAPSGPERSLLVSSIEGRTHLVLLLHEPVTDDQDMINAYSAYRKRWVVEESTRATKESRGWGLRLEDMRTLTYRGVRRMALLVRAIYMFMAEVRESGILEVRRFTNVLQTVGKSAADPLYRMIRGAGKILGGVPKWLVLRWRRQFG